jgi:UDPglucose 6-dehydrogenase
MHITIIGSGYVGLVSGVCLAAKGHHVHCVEIQETTVEQLNRGLPHIHEKGLEGLLKQVLTSGHFSATTDLEKALDQSEGVLIAVGTPSTDGEIDLRFVREVACSLGGYLKTHPRFLPVVVKSTVIPGTTDTIVRNEILNAGAKSETFGLGMNPEFLREGEAIDDFMNPDRIVMGYEEEPTRAFLEKLYTPWDCDKLYVNTRTAELIKYANNALLATQISAINEIANLAAAIGGIDVMDVVQGVHLDKRWNPIRDGQRVNPDILSYLVPGCGFGGSCLPKDVRALCSQGETQGLSMTMLDAVLDINDSQPSQILHILKNELGDLKNRSFLLLGLAFKPGTDDVRESASLKIVQDLLAADCKVTAHDPVAIEKFKHAMGAGTSGKVNFTANWRAHIADADVIIVVTKWPEYMEIGTYDLSKKVVFDARRMFNRQDISRAHYLTIGRRIAS